jgi:hypothetical protein
MDIVTSNVSFLILPKRLDTVYQGPNLNAATFQATVDSISLLSRDNNPANSLYSLRVFEYNSSPNPNTSSILSIKLII